MDVTPLIPLGRQMVESYGNGRFRVSGTVWEGSILVLPDETFAWPVGAFADLTEESLRPVLAAQTEVLLLGCGRRAEFPSKAFRQSLRAAGVVVEPMDTGAAARTFNVLMTEGRRAAAALIAVE